MLNLLFSYTLRPYWRKFFNDGDNYAMLDNRLRRKCNFLMLHACQLDLQAEHG